jgi:hypothetical protein
MLIFERVHAYSSENQIDKKTDQEKETETENPPLLYMIRRDSVVVEKRLACCAASAALNKVTQ